MAAKLNFTDLEKAGLVIFSSTKALDQWLDTPAPALDGRNPRDVIDTDTDGLQKVIGILTGLAYGHYL